MSDPQDRLRVPPSERFAGNERRLDLEQAFAYLPIESVVRRGHIQKTLYRLGPTTTAIFAFEKGALLERYAVDGEAIIHVIAGHLQVRTESKTYDLGPHQLLLLDPGVPHELRGVERTQMLLTVVLEDGH